MMTSRLVLSFKAASLMMCFLAVFASAQDPICGTWRFYDNSVREFREDGSGGPVGKPADTTWTRISPPSAPEPVYQLIYGNGIARDQLTLRNQASELWGRPVGGRAVVTARRQVKHTAAPAINQPMGGQGVSKAFREALVGYYWSWTGSGSNTTVTFDADGKLKSREGMELRWEEEGERTLRVTGAGGLQLSLMFDAGLGGFVQTGVPTAGVRGERGESRSPASPMANESGKPALKTEFQGMLLGPDWMPDRLGTDSMFLASLWYYGNRVAGDDKRGEETAPDVIYDGLRWLMPLDEAVTALGRVSKMARTRVVNPAYPQDSLTVQGVQGEFRDGGMRFNLCYLLADTKLQLVSVQFVAQTASKHGFDPKYPVENREPYFDLINEKRQASTTTTVSFQIIPIRPGLKLVKTVNHKILGPWLEDVHWYLPAPLAGRFIEIGEKLLPPQFKK